MNNRNKRTEDCHDNRRSRDSLNSKVHDLNIRVDSLSSTCQNLEEEVATLKLQISQLKQELKEVKETNKQSNKKRVYGHDPTTMTYLRTLYSNCVANGYRWEVDKTLLDKHSTNKQLYDRLVELMVKKLVPDDMEGKEQKVNEIKLAVRKHHEVLRYDANITQERRQRHKMNNKFRYKRLKKLRKRLHVYNKLKITGQFQHEYGNEEQIMPYLNQLYMSDEEENELVIDADTKYSTHVKRYVPKWRSRKLNEFYHLLDKLYNDHNKPHVSLPASDITTKEVPIPDVSELGIGNTWGIDTTGDVEDYLMEDYLKECVQEDALFSHKQQNARIIDYNTTNPSG